MCFSRFFNLKIQALRESYSLPFPIPITLAAQRGGGSRSHVGNIILHYEETNKNWYMVRQGQIPSCVGGLAERKPPQNTSQGCYGYADIL